MLCDTDPDNNIISIHARRNVKLIAERFETDFLNSNNVVSPSFKFIISFILLFITIPDPNASNPKAPPTKFKRALNLMSKLSRRAAATRNRLPLYGAK